TKVKVLSQIGPHLESTLKKSIEELNYNNSLYFPATCFAPDTDPRFLEEFYRTRSNYENSLGFLNPNSRYNLAGRWSSTATNGGGLGQGDITTLTWSYVADGTPIGNNGCGFSGEVDDSDFISFFNNIYGAPTIAGDYTTAPWHQIFIDMFNSWSVASGLIFVYEPNDDGATVVTGGSGQLGVRGDLRISGHPVDGNFGVLACNYYPQNGDMIIDTADIWYSNNSTTGTSNVLAHEVGHGVGLAHVCPVNQTKLMEPFVNSAFIGPQEDDILATNRHYGDVEGVNDTPGTSSLLGSDPNPTGYEVLQRSIDDVSDIDYYSFTVNEPYELTATLTPTGTTYLEGVQLGNGSCSAGTNFNAQTISDIKMEVLDTDGSTILAAGDTNGAGIPETISSLSLATSGTYYVRVSQQGAVVNNVQMYNLELGLSSGNCFINDGNIQAAVDLWISDPTTAEATYGNISSWDTSCVTDMSDLFRDYTTFNDDISQWDVSNVTNMSGMFRSATLFNQPIGDWNVSNVINMSFMFGNPFGFASGSFNQDIGSWDVSSVSNMDNMFEEASSFNQDIGSWNVSNVTSMFLMFREADSFNQYIGNWDVSSVSIMNGMFEFTESFNQDIGSWDVSNTTNMRFMFSRTESFNQDISNWNVNNVSTMESMFWLSEAFNQDLGAWDVSNVTNMDNMLSGSVISTANYDAILQAWAAQTVQNNINLGAGGLFYCNAEAERQSLIDNFGWTIEGDAVDPNCSPICEIEIIASATEICAGESVDLSINNIDIEQIEINTGIIEYNFDAVNGQPIEGFQLLGEYNNHYYYKYNTSTSWLDADILTRANGGYLACLDNQNENDFVWNSFGGNKWIGYYDSNGQENNLWVNGQPSTYENWRNSTSEPNTQPGEPYTMMSICFFGSSGNWVDLANISNNNGSCYSDVFPVMEVDPSIFSSSTFILWSTGETTENITITPTETTEYWVDVTTNGVTCREYITINVINPEITASAIEICAGESVDLSVASDSSSGSEGQLINELNHTITSNIEQAFATTLGLNYRLEISGLVTWGTYCPALANDPAYVLDGFYGAEGAIPRDFGCNDPMFASIFCEYPGLRPIPDEYDDENHTYDYYFTANTDEIFVGFFDFLLGDNCGSVTFKLYENSTPYNITYLWSTGDTTENITVTPTETTEYWVDVTINGVTCREYITINVDAEDPTWLFPPSDLTVACDGSGNTTEFNNWLNNTFSGIDNCGPVTITTNSSGLSDDCGATGTETVTFTLTDSNNNAITLDATFTIEDTTAPVIGCPGDVTAVTEDGDCGAIVNFQPAVATDNCGSAFTYQTGGLATGSVFPVGDTLIEYTAQDDCGNLATCTFTVTVIDDDAPVAICQDLTVILDDTGNATITADQLNFGSNDNCGVESLAINVDTFDCSNVGANEVTLTVTDIHGNTATCVATVTVLDNTAPIAVCQDITLELGDDGTVTIDPLAVDGGSSDACGIASYELDIDTLDCSNLGNTAVILTVTDVNGNQSLCSAIVTLEDNTPPVLVCNDTTVELNQDGVAFITPSLVADISDNCETDAVTINVQEVSCADIGTPVTVNVFANDGNGNSAVCSAVVTVVDLLAPEIVCPDNQSVNLDPNGTHTLADYIANGSATATDNCTDPVTIFSQDPVAGSVLGFGTQVITFITEDQYGNVSTCSFELDIQEILGAGDVEDFASLVLYPNPADSKVNLSNPRQIDLINVTIYDLTGRIVNKIDLSTMGSEITIDISTLANATYMLVIRGDQGISTKQLIVNNY
ncbi:BspA family leucine-rich repeat surface protein, partial [bacterium]|nr:BspA family leucine-rich repeat surface protein [bacterium]